MTALSADLRVFIQPGLAGTIATTGESRSLHSTRVWGTRCLADGETLELYVLRGGSEALLEDVERTGRAAVTLIEIFTYRSRAFKGRCRLSDKALDQRFLDECLRAQNAVFEAVGLGAASVERILGHYTDPHDMVGILIEVDGAFDQSPKPGAGGRL